MMINFGRGDSGGFTPISASEGKSGDGKEVRGNDIQRRGERKGEGTYTGKTEKELRKESKKDIKGNARGGRDEVRRGYVGKGREEEQRNEKKMREG